VVQRRINPETGRVEERDSVLGGLGGSYWVPTRNENGNQERINPETGRHEERERFLGGLVGSAWVAKEERESRTAWSNTQPNSDEVRSSETSPRRTASWSSSSSSSGGATSAEVNPLLWLVFAGAAYLVVVAGAFFLIQKVATWSFVWWLCVLAIAAGIPLYVAAAYAAFWLMVAGFALMALIGIVSHFIKNPF
jgi:hypothetical protein